MFVTAPTDISFACNILTNCKKGLKGIATYDRGDGVEANSGEELFKVTQDGKVPTQYFPELHKALLTYPSPLPTGADAKQQKGVRNDSYIFRP